MDRGILSDDLIVPKCNFHLPLFSISGLVALEANQASQSQASVAFKSHFQTTLLFKQICNLKIDFVRDLNFKILEPEPIKVDKPPAEPMTSQCVSTTTNDTDVVPLEGLPRTPGKYFDKIRICCKS